MTLRAFLQQNRAEIDAAIRRVCPGLKLNDEDRRQWVLNDEGLYRWARSSGVRI
jgi:gluconate kinase